MGSWTHVVWTWKSDGDVRTVYQNGVLVQTVSGGNEDGIAINTGSHSLALGGRTDHYEMSGSISDVNLYNKALTADEVKELYSGASVPFKYKGASQTELITNGDCSTDSFNKEAGWSYDATNQQYDCNASAGSPNINQALPSGAVVVGKTYRVEFDITNYVSGSVVGNVGAYESGAPMSANGHYSEDVMVITNSAYNSAYVMANVAFVGSVDNISVTQIGAIAEYDGSSATSSTWYDKSGNGLDGTVTGATLQNKVKALEVDNFTSTGIDDNAAATAMTIENGGNVSYIGDVTCNGLTVEEKDINYKIGGPGSGNQGQEWASILHTHTPYSGSSYHIHFTQGSNRGNLSTQGDLVFSAGANGTYLYTYMMIHGPHHTNIVNGTSSANEWRLLIQKPGTTDEFYVINQYHTSKAWVDANVNGFDTSPQSYDANDIILQIREYPYQSTKVSIVGSSSGGTVDLGAQPSILPGCINNDQRPDGTQLTFHNLTV